MDEGEGVLSATQEATAEAVKTAMETAKSAQEIVMDAAKANVEAGKEVVSTTAGAVSAAVGAPERPRKAKRASGSTKKPPLLHDLARPLENPRQKNRFARPHRRGERPQQKAAGVRPQKSAGFRPQNPEEVHGGAAEETARALSSYRLLTAGLIGRARSQKIVSFVSVKVDWLDSF